MLSEELQIGVKFNKYIMRITEGEVVYKMLLLKVSYYGDYARIALENYDRIQELLKERKVIDDKYEKLGKISYEENSKFMELNAEIGKYSRVIVVFCALAIEAFINDYAINHFSKSYLEKYLDKLDLMSKWIVIPRLVTGSQLDAGSQPLQDLDWLIRQRNELVHFKSRTVKASEFSGVKFFREQDAEKAISTVKNIVLELHNIDKTANETWLYHNDTWFPSERLKMP